MKVVIRVARPSDKPPLMSFIKDVWGGHDYIPFVWDAWVRDTKNGTFVIEADGVPVGMNRVRFLEDGSAWLEGARIHPDYRGNGFASMLGKNSMRFAKERGIRIFRLTSGSRNKAAHRQIARMQFKEVSRFSVYEPPASYVGGKGAAQRVTAGEFTKTLDMIRKSREYSLGTSVIWHDFTATSLSPNVVRALIEEGAVWRNGSAVAVTRVGGEGPAMWEEVCFVGGPPLDALGLVKNRVGRLRRATERWVFIPQGSPLIHSLRREGFGRNFAMILFERRAVKG